MGKKPLLAAVALAILAILLVFPVHDTYTDEGDDDPQYRVPEKAEPRYPDLGTSLNRMVASVEAGQAVEKVTDNGAVHNAGMVAVSIYLSGDTDGVVAFLEDNGGSPRNVGEDYIEAYVPATLLGQVSEQPGVLRVREIIPPQQTGPAATGDGDDIEITLPEKTELKYPNLGSRLDQLVASVEKGETSAKEAAEDAPVHQEASVAVTIYLSGNVDDVVKFLEDNGGSPRNVGEDYIEAYVPVSLLGQVSERPGVIRAREIASPQAAQIAQQVAGHGPPVHGSSAWNQAGFSGQGIKVGVVDSNFGFNDFMGLMGTELPSTVQARCYTDVGRFTSNLADCGNAILGDNHGTLVAEAVMDIAPEASLYIAAPWSVGDLRTATDWMVSEGVSVIVHSVIYSFDGPGDGTSPFSDSPLKTVDRAVAGGIVWVAGAGNYYHRTWFGTYSIVNVDGTKYVAFNGSDVSNDIALEVGDVITVQLRWEDSWSGTNRDFDLLIWDFATSTIVDYSFDPQQGRVGQVPFELLLSYQVPRDGRYAVMVLHEGGSTPGWIQLIVWGVGSIEHYTGTGSIGNPAESSNPGMLAVGAAHWNNVRTIEPYSSRGPTPDRRVKPDIVGADCGATALRNGFCGTSQAAPHVAGMAALVRQRFPTYTPVQVANYLKEHAEQRESPDPNNTWGHGFAQLPPLSECSDAVPSAASNPGLVADCEALLAARDTLAGSGTLNWSGSTAIAAWDGVTVGGSPLRVTKLFLRGRQLTGTIPPELGGLASLVELNLGENRLTGLIPSELSSLTNLEILSLIRNQLTGPIPAGLSELSNLEILALGGNQLTGPIPTWLGNIINLEQLYLGGNQLTGPIPASLGDLANLGQLDLSQNQLSGPIPTELGSLSKLQKLSLWGNQLSGAIPAELGSLSKLQKLSLWGNQLSGAIPASLGSLSDLSELSLSQNQLTGPIPAELGSLANLQELSLWGNQLTGTIPAVLSTLTNLEALDLSHNQLTGTIPAVLSTLTNLETLDLSGNLLTGPIPAELGNLSNLQLLSLWGNQLTGPIPAELGNLSNLQLLSLWGNQLTGTIPPELARLTNLNQLDLSHNQLTGPVPAWLGGLANLEQLSLAHNQLSGAIPTELGSLSKLQGLYLWVNQLSGPIPASLGGLANLGQLDLSQNQLSGPIPTELGSLSKLQKLSLWGNQLSGAIPAELGSLSKLQKLSLWGNQLSGAIPASLGSLSDLSELSLSQNQLTGPIPAELGSLANLQELSLWGNQLTGTIPAVLSTLTNLEALDLSHNQLTGPVPAWLGGLANLEQLSLAHNQLSGAIPTELGSLSKLQKLSLWGNQLSGAIPASLGSLSDLSELSLSQNQLTGPIPAELGSLANLQELSLWGNQLTGPIPASLGSLANLQRLSLWGNQFTGPIPAELGSLAKLEELFLSGNQLTGCIPAGIAGVANNDLNQLGLPFCGGAPGSPIIRAITPGVTFLTVTWAAPSMASGATIIAYDLRYIESAASDKSDANWTIVDNAWTTSSGALSYQISNLTSGTRYDVQVRAVTAAGDGPWSATAIGTPATWGAVRSLSSPSVSPGRQVVVTITASGYGGYGQVVETLPSGFSYVSSSLPDSGVTAVGREVRFILLGETDFTYTVTAPSAAGTYSFSGVLRNSDREDVPVGGALTIAVAAGDPLLAAYDGDKDGWIQLEEARVAVGDYFAQPKGEKLSLADTRKVVGLYFAYKNRQ